MLNSNRTPSSPLHIRIAVALAIAMLSIGHTHAAEINSQPVKKAPAKHRTMKQQTFSSPEAAAEALATAWHHGSKQELLKIFGPAGMRLVSSGDAVAEKAARDRMAAAYDDAHTFQLEGEQNATLILGSAEFPYPIPLVKQGNAWRFDTKAGEQEILDRRVGRNELYAIEVCRTFVDAQREYAANDPMGDGLHEYATKIISSPDKHDGLYWNVSADETDSPLGPLVAKAAAEGYGAASAKSHVPYHGYFYKILTQQGASASGGATDYVIKGHMTGGFALVAFPAKYGDSGIMTFIVNQHGIVFEKNLGVHTLAVARKITEYNPDSSWKVSR
jgi:hypothetical protein